MFCGRACHYDKLQFRCDSSGSGGSYDGQGNAIGIGHYSTMYSMFDSQTGPQTGFVMYCGSSITDQWAHGINVQKSFYGGAQGPWGTIETGGESWQDVTVTVTFINYSVYADSSGVWRTRYDSVEVAVNGGVIGTGPGLDFYNNTFIAPNSVPVYSGCLYCEHTTQADWFGATGRIEGGVLHVSAQGSGTFGVQWMVDGTWITTPISMPPGSQYAGGSNSYGFSLQSKTQKKEDRTYLGQSANCVTGDGQHWSVYHGIRTAEDGGAYNGWLFPNPPREAVRMNPEDYEAMVLRYGSYGWYYYVIDRADRDILNEQYVNVHPARSQYLARVTGGTHVFEDLLHEPTYCFVNESYNKSGPNQSVDYAPPGVTVIATDQPTVPPCGQTESQTFNYYVPSLSHQYNFPTLDRIDNGPIAGNLGGWQPWGTYFNTIGSPHYSYFLFYPTDDAWKINNVGVSPDELWIPARQQLIDHPDLPAIQRTRHIVDVVSEPLNQNGLEGLILQVSGNMPCYWGIGKMDVQNVTILDSVAVDARSKGRWVLDDRTNPDMDSSAITIPAGQTKVSFYLGSYYTHPFMTPHMAKEMAFAITDGNVKSCDVYLVANDGTPEHQENGQTVLAVPPSRILIGSSATGGRWTIPKGTSKKWITTAAYDGGNDWGTDTYVGIAPKKDDGSPDMIVQTETNVTLGDDLPTRTGVLIEFDLTASDDKKPTKIGFPTFYLHPASAQKVVKEAARHAALISPNGPVNRFGGGGYFDYFADSITSYINPESSLVGAPMAGDWLTHKRPWFLAKEAHDGLDDEIATIYEGGVEYTMDKHLWRDPFDGSLVTHSFFAKNATGKPVACMVNSYSAIPPTGAMPSKRRSAASDWKPTGASGCYTYSYIGNRKYVVSPTPLIVYKQGDTGYTNLLTPDTTLIPDDWKGGYFVPKAADDPVYVVRDGGDKPKDWFKFRAWRGCVSLIGFSKATKGMFPFNLEDDQGRLHRVSITKDGEVHFCRSDSTIPLPKWAIDLDATKGLGDCTTPRIVIDVHQRLTLIFTRSQSDSQFDVHQMVSDDDGSTWTDPTMLFPSCKFPTTAAASDGTVIAAAFEYQSGTSGPGKIKMVIQRPGDVKQSDPFYLHGEDDAPLIVAEDSFHVCEAKDYQGRWVLAVHMDGDDSVSDWWSADNCRTFTQVKPAS